MPHVDAASHAVSQLESPQLVINAQGQPYSERFHDIYASKSGALAQADAVFLQGVDLPRRWQGQSRHCVLELGFGLANNFIATYRAWLADPHRSDVLDYIGIEAFPVSLADWKRVAIADDPLLTELLSQWPDPLESGFHLLEFQQGRVRLILIFWDVLKALVELNCPVDSVYLDGFAPSKNPQMWSKPVLTGIRRLLTPKAHLASYSVASALRSELTQLGFSVRREPGFGDKKFRLAAELSIAKPRFSKEVVERIAIVGAGIVGVALAEELSRYDFDVTLFERQPKPAAETSGVPAALMHPPSAAHDSLEFGIQSHAYRLVRRRMRLLETLNLASGFHALGISEKRRNGKRHEHEAGGWLEPAVWINSLWQVLSARKNLRTYLGSSVSAVKLVAAGMQIEHGQGTETFDHVVLCNALGAKALRPELNLRPVGGQLELLENPCLPTLERAYCGQANVIPVSAHSWCIGNSYERGVITSTGRPAIREQLLFNASEMIGCPELQELGDQCQSWAGTRVESNARLPLIGEYQPRLWLNCAHASKGFMTAFLAAEIISAQLRGRALAIPERIRQAVDCLERAQ